MPVWSGYLAAVLPRALLLSVVLSCLTLHVGPVTADRCTCTWRKQEWPLGMELFNATTAPLHAAVARGDLLGVKQAVSSGSPVNAYVQGFTPLHVAVHIPDEAYDYGYNEDTYQIIMYLVSKGANPNLPMLGPEPTRFTIMHVLAADGRKELVYRLLKAGAKPDLVRTNKKTPLHQLAQCFFARAAPAQDADLVELDTNRAATAQVLLAFWANLNAKTVDGLTPRQNSQTPEGAFERDCGDPRNNSRSCPAVCKVLQAGITPQQRAAILSGKLPPSFESKPGAGKPRLVRCCRDAAKFAEFSNITIIAKGTGEDSSYSVNYKSKFMQPSDGVVQEVAVKAPGLVSGFGGGGLRIAGVPPGVTSYTVYQDSSCCL